MPNIESRLSKLEQNTDGLKIHRTKEERDETYGKAMSQARAVAAVCATWQDVAAYLKSLLPSGDRDLVSLDRLRQIETVTNSQAKAIFEEVRGC